VPPWKKVLPSAKIASTFFFVLNALIADIVFSSIASPLFQ
jgi:hypothetical protein